MNQKGMDSLAGLEEGEGLHGHQQTATNSEVGQSAGDGANSLQSGQVVVTGGAGDDEVHEKTKSDFQSDGKWRRKKLGTACISCRQLKRRCRGQTPCEYCLHRGTPCIVIDDRSEKDKGAGDAVNASEVATTAYVRTGQPKKRAKSSRSSASGSVHTPTSVMSTSVSPHMMGEEPWGAMNGNQGAHGMGTGQLVAVGGAAVVNGLPYDDGAQRQAFGAGGPRVSHYGAQQIVRMGAGERQQDFLSRSHTRVQLVELFLRTEWPYFGVQGDFFGLPEWSHHLRRASPPVKLFVESVMCSFGSRSIGTPQFREDMFRNTLTVAGDACDRFEPCAAQGFGLLSLFFINRDPMRAGHYANIAMSLADGVKQNIPSFTCPQIKVLTDDSVKQKLGEDMLGVLQKAYSSGQGLPLKDELSMMFVYMQSAIEANAPVLRRFLHGIDTMDEEMFCSVLTMERVPNDKMFKHIVWLCHRAHQLTVNHVQAGAAAFWSVRIAFFAFEAMAHACLADWGSVDSAVTKFVACPRPRDTQSMQFLSCLVFPMLCFLASVSTLSSYPVCQQLQDILNFMIPVAPQAAIVRDFTAKVKQASQQSDFEFDFTETLASSSAGLEDGNYEEIAQEAANGGLSNPLSAGAGGAGGAGRSGHAGAGAGAGGAGAGVGISNGALPTVAGDSVWNNGQRREPGNTNPIPNPSPNVTEMSDPLSVLGGSSQKSAPGQSQG